MSKPSEKFNEKIVFGTTVTEVNVTTINGVLICGSGLRPYMHHLTLIN